MTPAEFEWTQEQAELQYLRGELNARGLALVFRGLGFSPAACNEIVAELDRRKRVNA